MPTLPRFPLRIKFNLETRNGVDSISNVASSSIWRGNDLSIEVAVFSLDAPLDLSNLASLTLQIKDKQNPTSDPLAEVEVLAAAITATITAEGYADGTEQNASFDFTSAQTNQTLNDAASRSFWLVLSGLTSDGKVITYGAVTLVINEDNAGTDVNPPPVPESSYYDTDEVDALLAANKVKTTVTSIAALAALNATPLNANELVFVQGYYTAGDGGGGLFYLDKASAATANGGTVIAATVGRWLRIIGPVLDVLMFGAKCDGTTDDRTAIQAALTAGTGKVVLIPYGSTGVAACSNYLVVPANTELRGAGGSLKVTANITNYATFGSGHQSQLVILAGAGSKATGVTIDAGNFTAGGFCAANTSGNRVDACYVDNGTAQGVLFTSVTDGFVTKNRLTRLQHGVQIWTCDGIAVNGNTVRQVSEGGIWQASSVRCQYVGNIVSDCGDVGLDLEGGTDCVVSANTVSRCNNGELTIFPDAVDTSAAMKRLMFSGNVVRRETSYTLRAGGTGTTSTGYGAISIYALNNADHQSIVFADNNLWADTRRLIYQDDPASFTKTSGLVFKNNTGFQIGAGVFFVRLGGGVGTIFSGNRFKNITASNTGENEIKNCSAIRFEDNVFEYSSKTSGYAVSYFTDIAGITAGYYTGNKVLGAGMYGFKHDPFTSGTRAFVENNEWTGRTWQQNGGILATANGVPIFRNQTLYIFLPDQALNSPSTYAWDLANVGAGALIGNFNFALCRLMCFYGSVVRSTYESVAIHLFSSSPGGGVPINAINTPQNGSLNSSSYGGSGVAAATFLGKTITLTTNSTGSAVSALLKMVVDSSN